MDIDIQFTHEPIVMPAPHRPSRDVGACVEFQGIVRETEGDQALAGLFYEAYEPMARRTLHRHLLELAQRHPCLAVVFIHRLGWVSVGEASLYVCVFSVHRGEGLALLAAAVDRLKQDVPIWKSTARPREGR